MKKFFLVISSLLIIIAPAKAVNWQPVDTNIPNFSLYIDQDSIKQINAQEYVYAIKYNSANNPEKVAYLKSNASDNYIGVIQAGDFEQKTYRPMAVLHNPMVFMKPINDDSFLTFPHKYVLNMFANNNQIAENKPVHKKLKKTDSQSDNNKIARAKQNESSNIKPAAYLKSSSISQTNVSNMKEYVSAVGEILEQNWTPPASGRNSEAVVILTIGADGGLYDYRFAKSSGDEITDRSIITAIKQTVPYPTFPNMNKNIKNFNFQFVFNYGRFKKSVL